MRFHFFQLFLSTVTTTLIMSQAFADDIHLGTPNYGGNGCPQGTASATLSPDRQSLSILFDSYIAEAGGHTGLNVDRKSCNIAIPVHVPQGYSISVFKVDYRGYTFVPAGGSARFNVEYFFAGQRGPSMARTFPGFVNNNYLISNNIAASAMVWSGCGESVNLRINSSMMALTNSSKAQTLATVDSTDIKSGLIYHLQWRQCR